GPLVCDTGRAQGRAWRRWCRSTPPEFHPGRYRRGLAQCSRTKRGNALPRLAQTSVVNYRCSLPVREPAKPIEPMIATPTAKARYDDGKWPRETGVSAPARMYVARLTT